MVELIHVEDSHYESFTLKWNNEELILTEFELDDIGEAHHTQTHCYGELTSLGFDDDETYMISGGDLYGSLMPREYQAIVSLLHKHIEMISAEDEWHDCECCGIYVDHIFEIKHIETGEILEVFMDGHFGGGIHYSLRDIVTFAMTGEV